MNVCHYKSTDGQMCGASETSPRHQRNLEDPGGGRPQWFAAPNHLFRPRDFGKTNWPKFVPIQFGVSRAA